jgi:hypothetical protein
MVHDNSTLFQVFSRFSDSATWFSLNYFSTRQIVSLVYLAIPLAIVFEVISIFYGEDLNLYFLENRYRIIWIFAGIFVIFSLISPAENYRFLYQGF